MVMQMEDKIGLDIFSYPYYFKNIYNIYWF